MSTNNPFAKHTSNLFGDRADIDLALSYAHAVMSALTVEQDKTAMMTAIMVIVNTAAKVWPQSQGSSPAMDQADMLNVIGNLYDKLVADVAQRVSQTRVLEINDTVSEALTGWMDANLDDRLDEWVQNSISFEDASDTRIERWIENNLDVSTQVDEAVDNMDLSEKIESTINDMDLVVRVR